MGMNMKYKRPKNDNKYVWTKHAVEKMRFYGLTESRLKRVLEQPERKEVGVVEGAVAVVQTIGNKRKTEIWVMYKNEGGRKKIITVWRYPGVSPVREVPVPEDL